MVKSRSPRSDHQRRTVAATAGGGQSVHLWDTGTGKKLRTIHHPDRESPPFRQAAFSADGKTLLVSDVNCNYFFFDPTKGKANGKHYMNGNAVDQQVIETMPRLPAQIPIELCLRRLQERRSPRTSTVNRVVARRKKSLVFLDPEQIDAVDESKIPGYVP